MLFSDELLNAARKVDIKAALREQFGEETFDSAMLNDLSDLVYLVRQMSYSAGLESRTEEGRSVYEILTIEEADYVTADLVEISEQGVLSLYEIINAERKLLVAYSDGRWLEVARVDPKDEDDEEIDPEATTP